MDANTDVDAFLGNLNQHVVENNIVVFIVMTLTIIFGVAGNGLSCAYHGFAAQRKSVTNFLIAGLAVNDLITNIVLVDQIVHLRFLFNYKSDVGCKLTNFVNYFFVSNSILFLNPIAVDRCLNVCCLNPKNRLTKRKAIIVLAGVSAYSGAIGSKHLLFNGIEEILIPKGNNGTVVGHICSLLMDQNLQPFIQLFGLIDAFVFVLSNVSLAVIYGIMARKIAISHKKVKSYPLKSTTSGTTCTLASTSQEDDGSDKRKRDRVSTSQQSEKQNTTSRHERKINIMLGTVTLGSVLSFLPYTSVLIIINPDKTPLQFADNAAVQIAYRSVMLNSSINPYIIALFSPQFRMFVRSTFCKCFHAVIK